MAIMPYLRNDPLI